MAFKCESYFLTSLQHKEKSSTFKMNTKLINIIYLCMFLTCFYSASTDNVDSVKVYKETFLPSFTREDSTNSIESLQSEIKRILRRSKYMRAAKQSIAVYSLDRDTLVFEHNMEKALTPASATKLITTFAAMSYYGKDFGIKTSVYANGRIDTAGVLQGDLIMVGRGDALLSIKDIDILSDEIVSLGIDSIAGKFLADDSFFDDKRIRKEYSGDRDHVVKLAPLSALGMERNTATVLVSSGSYHNSKLNVQLMPESDAFKLNVTGKTRGGKKSKAFLDLDDFDSQSYSIEEYRGDAPPAPRRRRRTVRIRTSYDAESQKQHFKVSGYLRANRRASYAYYMDNPALVTVGALMHRLRTQGVKFESVIDTVNIRASKDTLTLLSEISRSMTEFAAEVNKDSDNFLAENLFKLTGALYGNYEDNAAGAKAVRDSVFSNFDIYSKNCEANDGSGLCRSNLISAKTLIDILVTADKSDLREAFDSTLSIAGVDGTLKKRMRNTAAEANLIAKTGTLRNASALAGYCTTLDGERLAFAFLFNGRRVYSYKEAENALGELLSQFFYFHKER